MRRFYLFFLVLAAANLAAQSPVKATFAYSRSTIPGIPGAGPAQSPFPVSYFIYVVIKKDAAISVESVGLRGKWHSATLKKVDSPVQVEHDTAVPTGKKDTLVGKTSDDVYQVEIGEAKEPVQKSQAADKLSQRYEVVVCLRSGKSQWHGLVKKIVALHPAAAM